MMFVYESDIELRAAAELELRKREKITNEKAALKLKKRNETLDEGRNSFWSFCSLHSPDYYSEDKEYLKKFVDTLQAFYEGRIVRFSDSEEWTIVTTTEGLTDYTFCKKIMINMPPRHGKSRTLVNFCQWVLGKNPKERIIECSYNDDAAGDFAKFTRDGIQEDKVDPETFVFSDFFPNVKLKRGSNSYYKWALEGQFFNYLGAGIGGSITGKGGSLLIIDDPIKLAEEAFNDERLEKIWSWYTNTFLSRGDAVGGEPLEIINMTRWSNNDICGRILSSEDKKEWFVLKSEAYNSETDEMLCEKVLSRKRYFELRKKLAPEILRANYHQETVDQQGRLYKTLKTYVDLPRDDSGYPLSEGIHNYTDTADEGTDFLCSVNYMIHRGEAYILDVIYTKDGMEITEPKTAALLTKNNLWNDEGQFYDNTPVNVARIESNNGGRGFARAVKRIINEEYKTTRVHVSWFFQSKNKKARILSNSAFVQEHIYFPVNWADKWPEFYKALTTYLKEGKKQNDDAPDTITGIAENIGSKIQVLK